MICPRSLLHPIRRSFPDFPNKQIVNCGKGPSVQVWGTQRYALGSFLLFGRQSSSQPAHVPICWSLSHLLAHYPTSFNNSWRASRLFSSERVVTLSSPGSLSSHDTPSSRRHRSGGCELGPPQLLLALLCARLALRTHPRPSTHCACASIRRQVGFCSCSHTHRGRH